MILTILPYASLLLFLLLAAGTGLLPETSAVVAWWGLRWLLRIGFVAGAYLGWRQGQPIWFFSWLGFAVYEAVATLLAGTMWLAERWSPGALGVLLVVLPLLAISFAPYFVAGLWVARRDRLLAAYSVFPHAALTVPLFALVSRNTFGGPAAWLLAASLAPLLVAMTAVAIFPLLVQRRQRWLLLYVATLLAQVIFSVGAVLSGGGLRVELLFVSIPLSIMGGLILTGPLALIALVQGGQRLLEGVSPQWWLAFTLSGTLCQATGRARKRWISSISPGGTTMAEMVAMPAGSEPAPARSQPGVGPALGRLYKLAVVVLAAFVVLSVLLFVGQAAVYKIHAYERGLHLRGGRFIGVDEPGWHVQIPLVDTVIIVKINERLGYVERIPAMTSDDVTMVVSLQYTYQVTDPRRFALEVDDPERIVFEFVQGKLRDVVNTKPMTEVMHSRAALSQEVMEALREKEEQYGVRFITVQMQSASPPDEVVAAIKDRMVAVQRQEQAQAEAAQKKTQADAEFYAAQKQADAQAYQIAKTAEAEAQGIILTAQARQQAVRAILSELDGRGALAEKYLQYLIAQELRENSKWIISGEGTPILDLRESPQASP